jgi:hypothetical protein
MFDIGRFTGCLTNVATGHCVIGAYVIQLCRHYSIHACNDGGAGV